MKPPQPKADYLADRKKVENQSSMIRLQPSSSCQCFLHKNCFGMKRCRYHSYKVDNIAQCFQKYQQKSKKKPFIAFLGDSRMRRLFLSLHRSVGKPANIDQKGKALHSFTIPKTSATVRMYLRVLPDKSSISLVKDWYRICKQNRKDARCPSVVIGNIMIHEMIHEISLMVICFIL